MSDTREAAIQRWADACVEHAAIEKKAADAYAAYQAAETALNDANDLLRRCERAKKEARQAVEELLASGA